MLKLELKRIFSKKINVFAIGLALILAVIFSGFAVTCKFCSNGTPILKSAVHSF